MRQAHTASKNQFAIRTTLEGSEIAASLAVILLGAVGLLSDTASHMMPGLLSTVGGAVVVILGLVALLARRGAVVDRRRGTVTRWWGLANIPLYRRVDPLAVRAVKLSRHVHARDGWFRSHYPVALENSGNRLVLAYGQSIFPTTNIAESLARFLEVSFQDETDRLAR